MRLIETPRIVIHVDSNLSDNAMESLAKAVEPCLDKYYELMYHVQVQLTEILKAEIQENFSFRVVEE